ncbi:multiple sugar transport system permease protein/alpha-1,4-digalacturonate transport system permease protein [Cryobacterium flavum]|uniref:Carbohydrate ABC transporter permease n=1 Tax=Cryobacterium flavum TaxID=1424659 RepID=A0A4R8VGP2_9MICO|nr:MULTISPECIES: carbohydrate ABC transporter permease [Cryobacterium]TFB82137.1 carbohydrate ABC transporter permease [Cryobacterium flavum]SDN88818.1 multiple sugar transport system permease protein/alpha-1,4-digalacturonate transport system permease protein [Cryobacterium flavum]
MTTPTDLASASPTAEGRSTSAGAEKRAVNAPRRPRRRTKGSIKQVGLFSALLLGSFVMLLPLAWVALSSLKAPDEILQLPVKWLPDNFFNFSNYVQLFAQYDFGRYIVNSFVVTGIGIVTSLVIALLGAYAFAYFTFPFKEPLFLVVLALFMVPQEALVIPMYLMISGAGLTNTYVGLAFPDLFTVLGLYLLRQFMEGIPYSYVEAARVDGASDLRILIRIITPMVAPAIVVFIIIKFMFTWNTFLWPMLVAQNESMYTVTVGLVNFAGGEFNQWNLINAATMISMIPTIILFITLQRYLVKGVAMSGMK